MPRSLAARPRRRAPAAAHATARVAVLRMLRRICAHLRGLQNSADAIQAYTDVESLLAREERTAAGRERGARTLPIGPRGR